MCTQNRGEIFGEIINGDMILNRLAKVVKEEFRRSI